MSVDAYLTVTGAYVREEFLTPEECETATRMFPDLQPGVVENASKVRRSSRVAFLLPQNSSLLTDRQRQLYDRLMRALVRANEIVGRFQIHTLEPLQLAEYSAESSGEYDWHLDIGPGVSSKRKLSISVQLSAPEDYDGGDLELWGSRSCSRKQGTLIAFPSYLLHRVSPVTRGVRRSLVAWAIGHRSYL